MDYILMSAMRLTAVASSLGNLPGINLMPTPLRKKAAGPQFTLTAVAQTAPPQKDNLAGQIYPVKL